MTRQRGAARLGVDPTKRLVLITGASQGARSINHAVLEAFPKLTTLDAQFLIATGAAGFKDFVSGVRAQAGKGRPFLDGQGERFGNLMAVPYLYDMPAALAASDLVVGRAGALSIAEITARGLPAILIPYPYAAENHQEKNARGARGGGRGPGHPRPGVERGEALRRDRLAASRRRAAGGHGRGFSQTRETRRSVGDRGPHRRSRGLAPRSNLARRRTSTFPSRAGILRREHFTWGGHTVLAPLGRRRHDGGKPQSQAALRDPRRGAV